MGDDIVAEEGYVLAVRILEDKSTYNTVEDPNGRMVSLRAGDVLAGTLGAGARCAAMPGVVPEQIAVGDVIDVLNLGGILGRCTSANPEIGPPFKAEVLGAVLAFPELGDRVGRPAHIRDHAIPPADRLDCTVPVVYVAGTCMNAGKTVAATELVRGLSRGGLRVAAAKLTGRLADARRAVHARRRRRRRPHLQRRRRRQHPRRDDGAASRRASSTASPAPRRPPDVIVAELGDGILGEYGVQDILRDPELMAVGAAYVLAAPDPVGCWGVPSCTALSSGLPITVITGPATDNEVGRDYVRTALGLPAHNALREAAGLVGVVRDAISPDRAAASTSAPAAGVKVTVIGAAGYVGGELLRLLAQHPEVERVGGDEPEPGGQAGGRRPSGARGADRRAFQDGAPGEAARGRDVVFLALEHGESSRLAGEIFAADPGLVVDLAADFRVRDPALARALLRCPSRARAPLPIRLRAGRRLRPVVARRPGDRGAGLLRHRRRAGALSAGPRRTRSGTGAVRHHRQLGRRRRPQAHNASSGPRPQRVRLLRPGPPPRRRDHRAVAALDRGRGTAPCRGSWPMPVRSCAAST